MNDIKKYVEDALKNAERVAIEYRAHGVSDYNRGRVHGNISAYCNILNELQSCDKLKTECDIFDMWINDVCQASPLTAGGAIEIYMFCDREGIPITDALLRAVIQLSLRGKDRYEITQRLKFGVFVEAKRKKHRWTRGDK
jgi:hypothetical protein